MSYYQSIYDKLRANGITEAGALAILGNWDCESNCEPVRVQGDFSPYRNMSKQYVEDVNTGRITRYDFMYDQRGFGLAQWTYFSRKGGLFDLHVQQNRSIGDLGLQVDFALLELRADFGSLNNLLRTSNDLYECTKQFCYVYENPAVKNVDARYASANRIKNEINLKPGPDPEPEPTPTPTPVPKGNWPPRTIDFHCKDWPEVAVLNSVLDCRGYDVMSIINWTDETTKALTAFQATNGLVPDAVAGPMTWAKLLAM